MTEPNTEQLAKLFKENERPLINKVERSDNTFHVELYVSSELSWFEGHFPEQPVLPGVVQIDWAAKFSQVLFKELGVFKQLVNVKFKSMVLPDTQLSIALSFDKEKGVAKFHLFNDADSFSEGRFKFSL